MNARMRMLVVAIITGALWRGASAADANMPAGLAIEARPMTHARDGSIQGCGLRFTGGRTGVPVSSWFDISINLFRGGVGIGQALVYEIGRSGEGENRAARVPVQSTWIKPPGGNARVGENVERRESLVYTILADDVIALFEAVAKEAPLMVGVRRWGQREDAVFSGSAQLSDESRHAISACLGALAGG